MTIKATILGMVALCAVACQNRAEEYAASGKLVTIGEDMPEDAGESLALVFDLLTDLGWETCIKDEDDFEPRYGGVYATGENIVWLPIQWDTLTGKSKASMAWHEYVHVLAQEELGQKFVRRKYRRSPYWRIAIEIPATAQTLEARAKYGTNEATLRELVTDTVANYPNRINIKHLRNLDDWQDLATDVLEDRIDRIFGR